MSQVEPAPSLKKALDFSEVKPAAKPVPITEKPILKTMDQKPPPVPGTKKLPPVKVLIILLIITAGVGSGYLLNSKFGTIPGLKSMSEVTESGLKVGDVVGSPDEKTFRDTAEGVIEAGGIDGEGSHKLLREGGDSQTAYLTSSVVDLDQFVGHKVQVWGETFAAQTAGWLMDIGRVKVVELNAAKPF